MGIDFAPGRIILVHGTILVPWLMKKPTWIGPGHALYDELRARYPAASVEGFRWRGGNLHADRVRAAVELTARIDAASEPLLIIGHSHGGNVARMALQAARRRDRPTALLTLATPFLNVRWFPSGRGRGGQAARITWRTWWIFVWSLLLALVILLSMKELGVEFTDPARLGVDVEAPPPNAWSAASAQRDDLLTLLIGLTTLAILAGAAIAVVMTGLALVGRALLGRARRHLPGLQSWRDVLTFVDTRDANGALRSTRSMTAAVEDDEAAWSLNVGQAAGSIGATLGSSAGSRHMHGWVRALFNTIVTAALAVGTAVAVQDGLSWEWAFGYPLVFLQGPLGGVVDEGAIVIAVVLLIAGAFGVVGMGIQMVEYLAAGWDSIAFSRVARFSVSSLPPGRSRAALINHVGSGGLRHSAVYEDERVRDDVLRLLG